MTKGRQDDIARRRLWLLQALLAEERVSKPSLVAAYEKQFGKKSGTLERDIADLAAMGIRMHTTRDYVSAPPASPEELWRDTVVGRRGKAGPESKATLARETVRFLDAHRARITRVLLGTGTTVYEVAREMLSRHKESGIKNVYTSNLLVLNAFVLHRPLDIVIDIAPGRLDVQLGAVGGPETTEFLGKTEVDAVITSFDGLTTSGFTVRERQDIEDKRMNLRPHKACTYVIIPLSWSKLAGGDRAITVRREKPQEVLDQRDGKREYVILTDPPDDLAGDRDREREEILRSWEALDAVTVIRIRAQEGHAAAASA